jgi:hypothetical protein
VHARGRAGMPVAFDGEYADKPMTTPMNAAMVPMPDVQMRIRLQSCYVRAAA